MVMRELHEGPLRGHFATKMTQFFFMDGGYWWPTIYKDVHDCCKSCDACQRIGGLVTQSLAKLVTSFLEEPFMKWGLWFCGANQVAWRYTRKKNSCNHIMLPSGWKQDHWKLIL
jgi:hypothetical protein